MPIYFESDWSDALPLLFTSWTDIFGLEFAILLIAINQLIADKVGIDGVHDAHRHFLSRTLKHSIHRPSASKATPISYSLGNCDVNAG